MTSQLFDLLLERAFSLRHVDPHRGLRKLLRLLSLANRRGWETREVRALLCCGAIRAFLSEFDPAQTELEDAYRRMVASGDHAGVAHATMWLGFVKKRRGDLGGAMEQFLSAYESFCACDHAAAEAEVLNMMGSLHRNLDQFDLALEAFREARAAADRADDPSWALRAVNNVGTVFLETGYTSEAEGAFREALSRAQTLGSTVDEIFGYHNLGMVYLATQQCAQAGIYARMALELARERGIPNIVTHGECLLGRIHLTAGEPQLALACFLPAGERAARKHDPYLEATALVGSARARTALAEPEAGLADLARALALAEIAGIPDLRVEIHEAIAEAHASAGSFAEALAAHREFHARKVAQVTTDRDAIHRGRTALLSLDQARIDARRQELVGLLRLLKAQMEPHLVLNTINSVSYLIRHDPAAAGDMLQSLGDLLRQLLSQSDREQITLGEEFRYLGLYVALESARLEHGLELSLELPDELTEHVVPHLLIQPLVENAIHHGLTPLGRRGRLSISAQRSAVNEIRVRVRDNGVGMPVDPRAANRGVGLRNSRLRLRLLYGGRASLVLASPAGGGTEATLVFPVDALTPEQDPATLSALLLEVRQELAAPLGTA